MDMAIARMGYPKETKMEDPTKDESAPTCPPAADDRLDRLIKVAGASVRALYQQRGMYEAIVVKLVAENPEAMAISAALFEGTKGAIDLINEQTIAAIEAFRTAPRETETTIKPTMDRGGSAVSRGGGELR